MLPWFPTGLRVHDAYMAFEITLTDHHTEVVADADTGAHDKTMTTFYRTGNARQTIDCWSVPVASIRTDNILMVRMVAGADVACEPIASVHHLATA